MQGSSVAAEGEHERDIRPSVSPAKQRWFRIIFANYVEGWMGSGRLHWKSVSAYSRRYSPDWLKRLCAAAILP